MKLLNYNNIMCLSPHPDDVEYSISGTIKKFSSTKFTIILLSRGTVHDKSFGEGRINEVRDFWKNLNVNNIDLHVVDSSLNFENTNDSRWIKYIEDNFNLDAYDAILSTPKFDTHYEHIVTNRIFKSLGRGTLIDLIEYKTPSTTNEWEINLSIDITDIFELKQDSLKFFKSQLDSKYFKNELIEVFHKNFITMKKGGGICEEFRIINKYI